MKFVLILFLSLFCHVVFSQEQLGLRLENYAGTSSLSLNPTGNLTNPLKWDINLVGAGAFFENNYFFIRQTNMPDLLRNAGDHTFSIAENVEGRVAPDTYILDFFDDDRKRFLAFGAYVDGPSVAVKIGENHSAGVFTRVRTMAASHNIPNDFSYYKYDGRAFHDPFDVPKFQGALMTWAEIGLNYAVKIPNYKGALGLGINVRYLQGFEAGYVENAGTWEHTKFPGDSISVAHPHGRFGYTSSNLNNDGFSPTRNGSGFGFDIGVTQIFEDGSDFYKLRLSAALLDIGYINFNQNAASHVVNTESTTFLAVADYEQFNDIEAVDNLVNLFSQQTLGDSTASLASREFTLALPTAFSLQADYAITGMVFANATLVQRFPIGNAAARRGNLFAITPRFEHRWFSASFPLALYNWQDLRVGFAARLGYLVVGSDNLGSFIGKRDFTGTDIYFALKFNPFEMEWNLFGGGGKRNYGKKGKVKCYDF